MVPHDAYPIGAHVRFNWEVYGLNTPTDPYRMITLTGVIDAKHCVRYCGCIVGECNCDHDEDEEYDPSEDEPYATMYSIYVDEVDPETYSLLFRMRPSEYDRARASKLNFDVDSAEIIGFVSLSMPVLDKLLQVKGETVD